MQMQERTSRLALTVLWTTVRYSATFWLGGQTLLAFGSNAENDITDASSALSPKPVAGPELLFERRPHELPITFPAVGQPVSQDEHASGASGLCRGGEWCGMCFVSCLWIPGSKLHMLRSYLQDGVYSFWQIQDLT